MHIEHIIHSQYIWKLRKISFCKSEVHVHTYCTVSDQFCVRSYVRLYVHMHVHIEPWLLAQLHVQVVH